MATQEPSWPTVPPVDEVLGLVLRLVSALDVREHETQVHSIRIAEYALRLAGELDMTPAERMDLKFGAMLHDIGKIGVPEAILLKPGPLTDQEWETMRRHPMIGYQILRDIEFLEGAARIVLYHQERYDGSGYPFGLAGEGIPFGARLLAIVDTLDAMTAERPYRDALTYDDVARRLVEGRGPLFDPHLVDAFLQIHSEEWESIRERVGNGQSVRPSASPSAATAAPR